MDRQAFHDEASKRVDGRGGRSNADERSLSRGERGNTKQREQPRERHDNSPAPACRQGGPRERSDPVSCTLRRRPVVTTSWAVWTRGPTRPAESSGCPAETGSTGSIRNMTRRRMVVRRARLGETAGAGGRRRTVWDAHSTLTVPTSPFTSTGGKVAVEPRLPGRVWEVLRAQHYDSGGPGVASTRSKPGDDGDPLFGERRCENGREVFARVT